MKKLVLATRNQGKLDEAIRLLAGIPVEIVNLASYPDLPPVEENGATFSANAIIKAKAAAAQTGQWALADDSGLVVDALDGRPGVNSARYAGMHGDDEANLRKVLAEMRDVPGDRRGAKFVCSLALAGPDGSIVTAEGECRGRIGYGPKGENGFGYDPIFFLPQCGRMMAELTPEEKNRWSHRSAALKKIRPALEEKLAACARE